MRKQPLFGRLKESLAVRKKPVSAKDESASASSSTTSNTQQLSQGLPTHSQGSSAVSPKVPTKKPVLPRPKTNAHGAKSSTPAPSRFMSYLPRDLYLAKLDPLLSNADLLALQLSSKALREFYQHESIWERRVRNLTILPECLFAHPDYDLFTFDYRALLGILVSGGEGLASLFRDSGEPWQLAALLGEEEQLRKVYDCPRDERSDVAGRMNDRLIDFLDNDGLGIRDYMIMGQQEQATVSWMHYYKPGYRAADDKIMKQPRMAVQVGSIRMLECLVKHYGYDLKAINPDGESTLLYQAVYYGHRKMTEYLLGQGLSLDHGVECGRGSNFACIAAGKGHWRLYEYLLTEYRKRNNDFELSPNNAQSIMVGAVDTANHSIYEEMQGKVYEPFSRYTDRKRSDAFALAVQSGDIGMVHRALDPKTGWGKLLHDFGDGRTILHVAAEKGRVKLIGQLVEEFPELDPCALDNVKNTILHHSAVHGDYKATKALYNRYFASRDRDTMTKNPCESELFRPNKWGRTIVHIAAINGRLNFLHCLRQEYGDAPFQALMLNKNTALHQACAAGSYSTTLWLVHTVGLSLVARNKDGDTPLHLLAKMPNGYAPCWDNVEGILWQLDLSLITDYKNNAGDTVKDILIRENQQGMIRDLEEIAVARQQRCPVLNHL